MDKVTLPIRTKVAVWWLIVIGLLLSITVLIFFFQLSEEDTEYALAALAGLIIATVIGVSFIGPGIMLLMRTAGVRVVAITILTLDLFGALAWLISSLCDAPSSTVYIMPLVLFFVYLIPLILVILDAKKYQKITT
jgi:hypothetical protein